MVDIQKGLVNITSSVDPAEILCRDNTTVLLYDSELVKSEVQPAVCDMPLNDTMILLSTLVDHINLTALRELYIPDNFNPEVIIDLVEQLQELQRFPSVQVSDDWLLVSVCLSVYVTRSRRAHVQRTESPELATTYTWCQVRVLYTYSCSLV